MVGVRAIGLPWPQRSALGIGVLLTLLGAAGFVVTGFDDFAGAGPDYVLGLRVNPLQNLVYLVTGLIGLTVYGHLRPTRVFGALNSVLYLVVFAIGAPSAEVAGTGPLNANTASTVLHLLVGAAAVVTAQGSAWLEQNRRRARRELPP